MSDHFRSIVYIIDDDKSVRDALSMLLHSADMRVKAIERPDEFFDIMNRQENACIIIDVEMREMDGFEFQKQLHAKGINLPIIFLTASDSEENRQHAKQSGAIGYLRKPVDDQALLDMIQWAFTSLPDKKTIGIMNKKAEL